MTSACVVHIRGRVFTWFLPTAPPAAPLFAAINPTSVISMNSMFSVMLPISFWNFLTAKIGTKFGGGYLKTYTDGTVAGPHDDWGVLLRKRI